MQNCTYWKERCILIPLLIGVDFRESSAQATEAERAYPAYLDGLAEAATKDVERADKDLSRTLTASMDDFKKDAERTFDKEEKGIARDVDKFKSDAKSAEAREQNQN